LTHPNVVRIYEFGRDGVLAAVSMELVDGVTLGKLRLAQPNQVFSVRKLGPLVAQLCAALDYATGRQRSSTGISTRQTFTVTRTVNGW